MPIVCRFLLDILYRECLVLIVVLLVARIPFAIKSGCLETHVWEYLSIGHFFIIWIPIPAIVVHSFLTIKNAVVKITFNEPTLSLHIEYYSGPLFLKKRAVTFFFQQFQYQINDNLSMKIRHFIVPSDPPVCITFFQGHYKLKFNCNIGWTRQQFREIEQALREIKPPNQDIFIY